MDSLTAQQVLERMADSYAACKSYRDTGVVRTEYVGSDGNRTVEKPFKTAFIRPVRFRFEYYEITPDGPENRYIVWRSGELIRSWWEVRPEVEEADSLGMALAGATGVSGGSAHTIPVLLLPREIGGNSLADLADAVRIADGEVDGAACFRLRADFTDGPVELWIDKESFLIRRIDERRQSEDYRTHEVTTYEPRIDVEISVEELLFGLPRSK